MACLFPVSLRCKIVDVVDVIRNACALHVSSKVLVLSYSTSNLIHLNLLLYEYNVHRIECIHNESINYFLRPLYITINTGCSVRMWHLCLWMLSRVPAGNTGELCLFWWSTGEPCPPWKRSTPSGCRTAPSPCIITRSTTTVSLWRLPGRYTV